jgi:hypothetical protein
MFEPRPNTQRTSRLRLGVCVGASIRFAAPRILAGRLRTAPPTLAIRLAFAAAIAAVTAVLRLVTRLRRGFAVMAHVGLLLLNQRHRRA